MADPIEAYDVAGEPETSRLASTIQQTMCQEDEFPSARCVRN